MMRDGQMCHAAFEWLQWPSDINGENKAKQQQIFYQNAKVFEGLLDILVFYYKLRWEILLRAIKNKLNDVRNGAAAVFLLRCKMSEMEFNTYCIKGNSEKHR